jgi:His Kinase A (phospho-acceptor) domain
VAVLVSRTDAGALAGRVSARRKALLEIIGRLTVELSAKEKSRLCSSLMPRLKKRRITKKELAKSLGIVRSTLYNDSKLEGGLARFRSFSSNRKESGNRSRSLFLQLVVPRVRFGVIWESRIRLQCRRPRCPRHRAYPCTSLLAGGVAHDFNNLLGVILGYCELLEERISPDDSKRRMVEQIHEAGTRAAALTRQLLAFSRRQVLRPRVLDLNRLVSGMETLLRRLIGEQIEIATLLLPDLGHVKADPSQMEQIVMNLAVNARDAMPGGGTLTIETANVELDASYARQHPEVQPGAYVMLAMTDKRIRELPLSRTSLDKNS